uniref:Fibronectin type-III domain-containing protein n=1 Tax=Ditylenchus dipsaci TaxID=166011 RepID=A0A915E0U5_9BILA
MDDPRNANGKLTRFGVVKCKTRESTGEIISCEKEKEVPIGMTELRLDDLDFDSDYRFKVHAYTKAGQGPPNSADAKTLPEAMQLNVDPATPELHQEGIGDDHFNVSYKESDDTDWMEKEPVGESLEVEVDGLVPGTKYDVMAVSVQKDEQGRVRKTESRVHEITTTGVSPKEPNSEKERLHGREPILPKDRAFDEYGKIDDDEKKSLTGHSRPEKVKQTQWLNSVKEILEVYRRWKLYRSI